jgi:hypothetical protein
MFGFGMCSVVIVSDGCTYYSGNSLKQNNDTTREDPTKEKLENISGSPEGPCKPLPVCNPLKQSIQLN